MFEDTNVIASNLTYVFFWHIVILIINKTGRSNFLLYSKLLVNIQYKKKRILVSNGH